MESSHHVNWNSIIDRKGAIHRSEIGRLCLAAKGFITNLVQLLPLYHVRISNVDLMTKSISFPHVPPLKFCWPNYLTFLFLISLLFGPFFIKVNIFLFSNACLLFYVCDFLRAWMCTKSGFACTKSCVQKIRIYEGLPTWNSDSTRWLFLALWSTSSNT